MPIGSLISAGANLVSGFLGSSSASKANAQNAAIAQQNMQLQKDFAQRGIRWKVRDAQAAGIHPLYALGAPTTSFSPVSFSASADNSMANAVSRMGQDVGGAINRTRTAGERVDAYTKAAQALTLEKGSLENQLLASQIKRLETQSNPPAAAIAPDSTKPFAVAEDDKSEKRPPLMALGSRWLTNPNTSPMEAWEKQYGDEGPASWLLPILLGLNDIRHNMRVRGERARTSGVEGGPTRGQSFYEWSRGRR